MEITFVLGAGFSSDARFPLMRDLRERVESFMEFDRHSSYSALLEPCPDYGNRSRFSVGLEEVDPCRRLAFEELFAELRKRAKEP